MSADNNTDEPANDLTPDEPERSYYTPGEKLEGRDDFLSLPDDWENEGSAFELSEGRRIAHIESTYSRELDGGEDTTVFLKPKKSYKKLIVAGCVLAIGALLTVVLFRPAEAPETSPSVQAPLMQAWPKAPSPPTSNILVEKNKTMLEASTGASIAWPKATLAMPGASCEVTTATDFCLAGTFTHEGQTYKTYFFKDIVRAPVLDEVKQFTPKKALSGSHLTATVVTDFGLQDAKFLTIALKDSTGWLVEIPKNFEEKDVKNLMATLQTRGAA